MSVVSERLTGLIGTCNIVRQNAAVDQFRTASPLDIGSRSRCTRPQPSAAKSQLSDDERRIGNTWGGQTHRARQELQRRVRYTPKDSPGRCGIFDKPVGMHRQ